MVYSPFVLVAVLVLARSSAERIPNVSEISDSFVDQRPPVVGQRKLRVHGEATQQSDEERVGPPPQLDPQLMASVLRNGDSSVDPLVPIFKSSIPSLTKDKNVAETLSSNVPNKDVSHLKSNIELTQWMEELGINFDDFVAAVRRLRTTDDLLNTVFSEYRVTLMALGSEFFKNVESPSIVIESMHVVKLRTVMGGYVESQEFKNWITAHSRFPVLIQKVYGKMRYLIESGGLKTIDKEDLAEMAFGSEFFKAFNINLSLRSPKSESLDQPNYRIQHLINRDSVDPKVKDKLRAFANDPDFFDYKVEELLRRAKDAVLEDQLTALKSNKAFTQRLEELGINIDDIKVDVQMLRTTRKLPKYTDYSIALMTLGSKFFKKIDYSPLNDGVINRRILDSTMSDYVHSKEFKDWKAHRTSSRVSRKNMYAKLLWLVGNEDFELKNEELAEMSFGSEYFILKDIKLDEERVRYLDYLKRQLKGRGDVSKEVINKLDQNLEQGPNSVLKRKVEHAMLGALMDEETNKRQKVA